MNKVIKNNEKYIEKLYDDAVAEEKRWATYLFSKGSMVGLSEKLLHNYVEWTANKRMKAIGLKPKYDQGKSNPLLGLNIGLIVEVYKTHHKKQKLKVMLSVVLNKMLKKAV